MQNYRQESVYISKAFNDTTNQAKRRSKSMTTQPVRIPDGTSPPWQTKTMSYGMKLLVLFVFVLALIIAISSVFILIGVTMSMIGGKMRSSGSLVSDLLPLWMSLGVLVVSAAGVVVLWPLVRRPTNFRPSYGEVPANIAGQPFDVRFRKPWFARSFGGKGALRFDADQLVLDGTLGPNAWVQIGCVVLLTVLPLVLLGIGLGVIPALLIAALIGRKKLSLAVPYAQLRDVKLTGSQLSFRRDGDAPNTVILNVSQSDGERLYREMALRFPAALGGWTI